MPILSHRWTHAGIALCVVLLAALITVSSSAAVEVHQKDATAIHAAAGVQSDLLHDPKATPVIHWHKIRHRHGGIVEDNSEEESPPVFQLEREVFTQSSEHLPTQPPTDAIIGGLDDEYIDLELHPQLRDQQHYAPIEEREERHSPVGLADFGGYDDGPYPPKFDDVLFGGSPIRDTARCFSCMSKFYEAVWPALSHVYKRPRNFTDSCNEEQFDASSVPVTHCSTICVQMWEEPTVAGVKIRGYIRGCLDEILHHGFNQSIVAWYRWLKRDSCHAYSKRDLFMLPHDQSDASLVNVCTCYADYCNAAGSAGATTRILAGCFMAILGRWALYVLSRL
uniref:Caenorhabditis elegans ly-6-related family-containing protein n=1 Tax=Panagrellus redivivus TaxID=6233 RepID=A0A7E4UTE6_PANRE